MSKTTWLGIGAGVAGLAATILQGLSQGWGWQTAAGAAFSGLVGLLGKFAADQQPSK